MSPSHYFLRFVFLASLSVASLSATGTTSTTAIPELLSDDGGGGGFGNRHLRGGAIRRQEQQRRHLFHSFNPTVDIYWLALHHHDNHPSPLPASHRQIQDSTPPTNNVHDDARRHSFVQQCTSFLLSSDIIHDGIISQIDFVDMLLHQCRLENLCNNGLKLNFGQLDVSLRKKFIRGICNPSTSGDVDGDGDGDHPPEESRFECIYKLYEMMREESIFGFDANVAGVDVLVKDMCYETYPGAVDFGFVSRTQGE